MTDLEFCLLGPLVVRHRGVAITVPRGKQRMVLALLLLNAGRVVRLDELAETLWVSGPPLSGPVAIQNYVMRLRNTLGDAGRARIITKPPGYLIRVQAGELDLSRFEALLGAARDAAKNGGWDQAAAHARQALQLWRGEPLTDVGSEALAAREAPRLAELRLQAAELRIDADLHLGRHAQLITELRQLAGAHPLRERLHARLMLALYRDGRQGEALAAYRHARDVLVAELGVEPGPDLRELHQRMLSADPALTGARPVQAGSDRAGSERAGSERAGSERAPGRSVPRELPPSVPGFTGRSAELAALTALADRPGQQVPGAVVVSAIGGTAGVGKTALAVHWAHRVAERFPDGQLYVNLRGYDPGQPMPAADALAAFLRSLGVPGQDIPAEADERAARYRSLLADRRMLVILDNAGSADQVRPLLPGSLTCTVVVTSRDALAGLVARDGATRLHLDVLPLADAISLLRTLIGPRAAAEPDAITALARQCCQLPLALRVAAELAAARSATPLAGLVSELADLRDRLDLLAAGGDPSTQVRAVFSWSYRHLDADAARAFRLLGLHPGPDVEPYAAAALADTTVPQARRALDVLAHAHLIQITGPGRYGMHDLLRGYASELAATDGPQEQHAALTRLFDHYLHSAATAMDTLLPAASHRRPRIPRPATPVPPLSDPAAARQWLDVERAVLVKAAAHSACGWPGHTTRLATTIARYLENGGHTPEARAIFGHALDAARRDGDRAAEAVALNLIGNVDWQQGRLQQAGDHYLRALALYGEAGDRAGEASALGSVGLVAKEQGRYEDAARHHQDGLAICREIADRFGEARALSNLGLARQLQRRYSEAAGYYQQALGLCRQMGDREGEGWALARLGVIDLRTDRYQPAAGYFQQALAVFQDIGARADGAEILILLGEAYVGLGAYEQAAGYFEQALAVFRETGALALEAAVRNGLGDLFCQTGEPGKAREHHAAALRLASEIGMPLVQARAHSGLARACQTEGDAAQARYHWQEALTRYTAIGDPEADEIRALLDGR